MSRTAASLLVGLAALITPTISSADLLSDLQAQIQALLAQVAALQSQQVSPPADTSDDYPTPPIGSSCPNLTVTLQRGSRDATTGGQVSALQIWLANRYGLNDDDVVTGYFGATTERYVKQFQQEKGLPVYGIVGSLTRAAIARECGPVTPPLPSRPYSVTITEPNGPMYVNYGQELSVKWLSRGDFPKGSTACVTLRQEDTGRLFAWPPQGGSCVSVAGAEPQRSVNGIVMRNSGYDLAPGAYRAVVRVSGPSDGGKDGPLLAEDTSDMYFKIVEPDAQLVDIKVNGSDGPTAIVPGAMAIVSWATRGVIDCRIANAQVSMQGGYLPSSGSQSVYLNGGSVILTCYRAGQVVSDRVDPLPQGTQSITVTAPNGGEQWEIGKLNTVTWAPYGYNPDMNPANDVVVYLVGEFGDKIGRIMDTGKASLHTYLNIDNFQTWASPGRYYVEAVNTVTGARDRSDAPFTILPRAVDLKVNGSDVPVTVSDNQAITVSWQIGAPYRVMEGGCTIAGVRAVSGGVAGSFSVGTGSGSATYYAFAPTPGAYSSVTISCVDGAKGLTHSDSVGLLSGGGSTSATLRVVSPNGGETLRLNDGHRIAFSAPGVKSASAALYRNDQWQEWIIKDLPLERSTTNSNYLGNDMFQLPWYAWSIYTENLSRWAEMGNVFKIYVTGLKADGTGYVDDKSDAPFRFVIDTQAPSCTVSTNKPSYALGEPIVVNWTSTNATYATFDPLTSSALVVPGDKLATAGTQSITAQSSGSHTLVMRVTAADSRFTTCAVPVSVASTTASTCTGGSLNTEYGGSCYAHFATPATHAAAKASCAAWGGSLAAVTSSAEEQHLQGAGLLPVGTFIGLERQANGFAWDTEEPLQYTKWAPGEPNNARGDENFVVWTYWLGVWGWNDTYDTSTTYLCERRNSVASAPVHVAAAISAYEQLIGALQQLVSLIGR